MSETPAPARRDPTSVYRVVQLVGASPHSWEAAASNAIEEASRSIGSDLRVAEVIEMDVLIEEGKVLAFRSKVRLSYKPNGLGA